jgi:hypothetical protein
MKLSMRNLSGVFFVLFFLSVALHKTNYLILMLIGINVQSLVGVSLLLFPSVFLILAYTFSKNDWVFAIGDAPLTFFIFLFVHILAVVGLISGNQSAVILTEYWAAWLVFLSFLIARDVKKWELFEKKFHVMFYFFSGLVALGVIFPAEHLLENLDKIEGITSATVAYQISQILDFWPLLFMMKFFKTTGLKNNLISFLPFVIYISFQVFFLKRAPSARAVAYIFTAITLYYYLKGLGTFLPKFFVTSFVAFFLIFFLTPKNLTDRFMTEDSARLDETITMFEQMSVPEHIFGKGLGGYFYNDEVGGAIVVDGSGELGKYILHIGVSYAYLKGGVVLLLLILTLYFNSIFRGLSHLHTLTAEQKSALCFLIVYGVFRIIEGPFSTGAIFDGVLFGLSLGILSKKSFKDSADLRKIFTNQMSKV